MRKTIGFTLVLPLALAGCDALSPKLSPEPFLRAEISGAERIRHEGLAYYDAAYSGTFDADMLEIWSSDRRQDASRWAQLNILGSRTAESGDVFSIVADPYAENLPERVVAQYFLRKPGELESTRYIASSGELRIVTVGDSLYAGTFWFRAFSTEELGYPTVPPEDTEWIEVEGEFSAAPPVMW